PTIPRRGSRGQQPSERSEEIRLLRSPGGSDPPKAGRRRSQEGGPGGSSPPSEARRSGCCAPLAEAIRRRRVADDPKKGVQGAAALRAKRGDQAAALPWRKRSAEGGSPTIPRRGSRAQQ